MGETSEIYYNNRIKLHITLLKDTIHICHIPRTSVRRSDKICGTMSHDIQNTPQNAVFPLTEIYRWFCVTLRHASFQLDHVLLMLSFYIGMSATAGNDRQGQITFQRMQYNDIEINMRWISIHTFLR